MTRRFPAPGRTASAMKRFVFCAYHALGEKYLWLRTLRYLEDADNEFAFERDLSRPKDIIGPDAEEFARHFFRIAADDGFTGEDYTTMVTLADDSTDQYAAFHNHVHHAIEAVYWKLGKKHYRFYKEGITDVELTQQFSNDADTVADQLLKYLYGEPIIDPFTAADYDRAMTEVQDAQKAKAA